MKQTSGTRLIKNTVIYMIGNLSSKVFQMLILPLLTVILLTEEYGYYDLLITTVNLVTPLVTLQMCEAMFRYLFGSTEAEKKETVSSVTAVLLLGILLLGLAIFIIDAFGIELQYPLLIYFAYITCIALDYMQKLARSQQKNMQVAISGVINTLVMLGTEAVVLLVFRMKVDGLLLSYCVSHTIATLYLQCVIHVEQYLSKSAICIRRIKELLHYSVPLVPNSICWWVVSACDRYIISFCISIAANGIYSIAGKFSQLLAMVTSVFQMAWQESSILEADQESRDQFYTSTFSAYMRILLGGYIVLLPVIRIIMPYFVAADYLIGYRYVPMLLLGAVFSAFSQFYGTAYLVFRKTNGAFSTTIAAAFINVTTGVCLINRLGLLAPALGTTLAFLIQWILRVRQMRSYFKVKLDYKYLSLTGVLILIYYGLYFQESAIVHFVLFLLGAVYFAATNREMLAGLIHKVKLKLFRG